jgi:alanine transaminase
MTKTQVITQAAKVRETLPTFEVLPPPSSQLSFSSSYQRPIGPRGFCNWLVPGRIMIGQYPGMTPEKYSASKKESKNHIDRMVQDANIRVFCCLQDEIPPQDDFTTWTFFDGKYKDFSHYGTLAKNALNSSSEEITFLHTAITDLSTPDSSSLISLLSQILDEVLKDKNVYIHCWGGRGRAGTVGAILLGILYPELESVDCLDWVQRAYDTRDGAKTMPVALQKSPQTSDQRDFVQDFISEIRAI